MVLNSGKRVFFVSFKKETELKSLKRKKKIIHKKGKFYVKKFCRRIKSRNFARLIIGIPPRNEKNIN